MQNEQYLLQPSITETNAVGPCTPGAGRQSNFSTSGKLTSTRGPRPRSTSSSIPGTRCRVRGPQTRSTQGARARIASPSWLATHPPTPMTTPGAQALERTPAPELGEHLLLRLLPHRARVDEEHVRFLRPLRELEPVRMGECVRGPRGIVLVHLAAVGADEELRGEFMNPARGLRSCSSSLRARRGRAPAPPGRPPPAVRGSCPGS